MRSLKTKTVAILHFQQIQDFGKFTTVLVFPKVFSLLCQQKVFFFAQKERLFYEDSNPNIQNMLEIKVCISFSPKYFAFLASRKWFICSKGRSFVKRLIFQNHKWLDLQQFQFYQKTFWLAQSGLFAQKAVDLYKHPKCAENRDLEQFQFYQKTFCLAQSGLFAQKAVDLYKLPKCAENPDLEQFQFY